MPTETPFPSDVSEKTDSDSTVVTVITRESNSVVDDVQSLFSVDQDGFFTSMHTDSGLAVQTMKKSTRLVAESSSSTDVDNSRNTSVETKTFDMQSPDSNESSDVVSVTALTMQMSSSFILPVTDHKLDISNNSGNEYRGQNISRTLAEKDRSIFCSPSVAQSVMGAFPSFCTVTPPSSDDEDAGEVVSYQADYCDWSGTCSILSPGAAESTPLPPVVTMGEHNLPPDDSLLDSCAVKVQTAETSGDSRFSTWPCSPVPGNSSSIHGILKSNSDATKCRQKQKFIKFSPVVSPGQEASCSCELMSVTSCESRTEIKASPGASSVLTFDRNQELDVKDSSSGNMLLNGSDDSTLLTEQTTSEGTGAVLSENSETLTASDPSASEAGIAAAIVISSPVVMQCTYVENKHRRLLCRPVRPDEWHKFSSYESKGHWSSTLPRNLRLVCRTSEKCGSDRPVRRSNTERSNAHRWQRSGVLRNDQLGDRSVCVIPPSDAVVPLTMLHSPRRYGVDGKAESFQTISSPTSEHAGKPAEENCQKVATETAMVISPAYTMPPKNMSELRDTQHDASSRPISKHSTAVPPPLPSLSLEGNELQKPNVKLMTEVICENEHALSGMNLPCKSPVCQRSEIQFPAAELRPPDSVYTSVDFGRSVNADACAAVIDDGHADGMQRLDVLRGISSAAVCNVSGDRDSIARSLESISSTLSAAERSRATKLAFLGFRLSEADQQVINSPVTVMSHDVCIFPARSDDTSISCCSSSGLGSSVSGSPVVSPDEIDVDQTSSDSARASCTGLVAISDQQLLGCMPSVKFKATVPLTDQSKQTAV